MKKFFYLLGIMLFSLCVLVSCSSLPNKKVKANISEESHILFSGQNASFYATITVGVREEPYDFNGISNKKVDFSVISLSFFKKNDLRVIECQIEVNGKTSQHILEKNLITGAFMFDLEKYIKADSKIQITALSESATLVCKSQEFLVDYKTAIEIATKNLQAELDEIYENKDARFEVFLKLATNTEKYDDTFVWYFILKSTIEVSATVVIETMQENSFSKLNF
jgi:hypothetical protein